MRVAATDSEVRIEISDDGQGFAPPPSSSGHMGLQTMNDRARELGGTFTIRGDSGGGTRVALVVPVAAPGVTDDV